MADKSVHRMTCFHLFFMPQDFITLKRHGEACSGLEVKNLPASAGNMV